MGHAQPAHRALIKSPQAATNVKFYRSPNVMNSNKSSKLSMSLLLLFSAWSAHANPLRVCIFDQDYENVSFLSGEAPGQFLVRKAAEDHGDTVVYTPLPGKRCAFLTARGDFDAALGAAWNPTFAKTMRFPMAEHAPNPALRVGETAIRLVRHKGSQANWTGSSFEALHGSVAMIAGSETTRSLLLSAGADPYEVKTVQQILKMVTLGRVPLAALRQVDLYRALATFEDKDTLEVLPLPFKSGALYLGVSALEYGKRPQYFEALWHSIGQLRARPGWAAIANELMQSHGALPNIP